MERFENVPKVPTQSEGMESIEANAREHIQLRIDWAEAVAKMRGTDFVDELSRNTDLDARVFGVRRPRAEVETDPRWQNFIAELRESSNPTDTAIRTWKQEMSVKRDGTEKKREFFGPFRYDYDAVGHEIHIHFGSMAWYPETREGQTSITTNLKEPLKDMFTAIKSRHPEALKVGGGSWLFSRLMKSDKFSKAIREILPPDFIESALKSDIPAQGGGRWGQFVDNHGALQQKRASEFRSNMQNSEIMTEDNYIHAFPIQPLELEAPVQTFYDFYGIE